MSILSSFIWTFYVFVGKLELMTTENAPRRRHLSFRKILGRELKNRGFNKVSKMGGFVGLNAEYLRQILKGTKPPPSDDLVAQMAQRLWPRRGSPRERRISNLKSMGLLISAAIGRSKGEAKKFWRQIRTVVETKFNLKPEIRMSFADFASIRNFGAHSSEPISSPLFGQEVKQISARDLMVPGSIGGIMKDDSMEPEIEKGSFLIFFPFNPGGKIQSGQVYLLSYEEDPDNSFVRMLYPHDPKTLFLRAFNPAFPQKDYPRDGLKIWGTLIWSIKEWSKQDSKKGKI